MWVLFGYWIWIYFINSLKKANSSAPIFCFLRNFLGMVGVLKSDRLDFKSLWIVGLYWMQLPQHRSWHMRSNFRLSHNGRFVINPVYPVGCTMVAKILNFKLFESLKNALSRTFCSAKLSLGSWISHFLCENFPEYPPDIILWTSIIV